MREKKNGQSVTVAATLRRAQGLREFAASFGVSYDSVFRAAKAGKLKTFRFGKRVLIPADEADRVLREGI